MREESANAGSVRLAGLKKSYANVPVVDDVSLKIEPGEIIALLGPSGCGKTTTLRMIAGLETPDSGKILVGDRAIEHLPVEERDIGLLFQSYALFPHMTVLSNVMFGLRTWRRRVSRDKAVDASRDALRLVHLQQFEDRYPSALSGGQQQRVALARALVTEPRILLLDEPLSALDKNLRVAMQTEIRSLVSRLGLTTIMVTHDQEEAMVMADRVAVMHRGRVIQVGSPADLYERPRTRFVADFVGSSNIFAGIVEHHGGARKALVTPSGFRLGIETALGQGEMATVIVRPERLRIAHLNESADFQNRFTCVVETLSYRGSSLAVTLRTYGDVRLQCLIPNIGNVRVPGEGENVDVGWDDDANVVVESDS